MLLPRELHQELGRLVTAWRERWRLRRELQRMDGRELRRSLSEVGSSIGDVAMMRAGSARDIARMTRHFGIDRAKVPPTVLGALRDAERLCAHCRETGRCHRWLAGATRDAPQLFCPNAETLHDIAAHQRDAA